MSRIERFTANVPANAGVLFDFRQALRGWLLGARIDREVRDALVLAVHEAVANGFDHANGSPIRVEGSMDDGGLQVEITTRGPWVPSDEPAGALAEHGRGLALMRGLTDELDILVEDESVTIRLRARRG